MKKTVLIAFLTLLLFVLLPRDTKASLLVIKEDGEVIWKVLSEEDVALDVPKHSFIEVRSVAESNQSDASQVTLRRTDDKISLIVSSDNQERELDVTDWDEDLVEIEERAETQKVKIGLAADKFTIVHKGVTALTDFPIIVDSESAELSVETPTGKKYLSVFPYDAIGSVLRAKLINRISDKKVEIIEVERELQYKVSGEKVFNFFDVYEYPIPISYYVSASTGEILSVDAPGWLKVVGFLFT